MAWFGMRPARGRGVLVMRSSVALCGVAAIAIALLGKAQASIFDSARAKISDIAGPALLEVRAPLVALENWIGSLGTVFTVYRENLELNSPAARVDFREHDLSSGPGDLCGAFDLVLANLTGALLYRSGNTLAALARPGASLIASGFQVHELDEVTAALRAAGWSRASHLAETDWIGATFTIPTSSTGS